MKIGSLAADAVTDFKTVSKGFLKELPRQVEAAAIWFAVANHGQGSYEMQVLNKAQAVALTVLACDKLVKSAFYSQRSFCQIIDGSLKVAIAVLSVCENYQPSFNNGHLLILACALNHLFTTYTASILTRKSKAVSSALIPKVRLDTLAVNLCIVATFLAVMLMSLQQSRATRRYKMSVITENHQHCESPGTSKTCLLRPWIAQLHGFLEIHCADLGINKTVGFYPFDVVNDLAMDQALALFATSSSANFLGSSSVTTGTSSNSLLGSGIKSLHGGSSSSSLALNKPLFMLNDNPRAAPLSRGWIKNDDLSLEQCLDESPCLSTDIHLTPGSIEKVLSFIEKVRRSSHRSSNDPVGKYDPFKNNCVDFMRNAVAVTGDKDWISRLAFNRNPNFVHKTVAIAWHYFHLTN